MTISMGRICNITDSMGRICNITDSMGRICNITDSACFLSDKTHAVICKVRA